MVSSKLKMILLLSLPIQQNVNATLSVSRAERAKQRAERGLEEATKSDRIDEVQRAQVALRRALNRISVGTK